MSNITQSNRYLLLYGSQTGQAQAIAEELKEKSELSGLSPSLHCLGKYGNEFVLEKEKLVVFLISTTGDGEFPDTVNKAFRRLKKRSLSNSYLKLVRYSLLALGDSNYTSFCNAAKRFDQRLEELGAARFLGTRYADDAVGLEVVAEPWLENVILGIKKELNLEVSAMEVPEVTKSKDDMTEVSLLQSSLSLKDIELSLPPVPKEFIEINYLLNEKAPETREPLNGIPLPSSASKVFNAKVLSLECLTDSKKVKLIYEMKLEILNPDIQYQPGDAFGLLSRNAIEEVTEILKHVGVDRKMHETVRVHSNTENKKIPKHLPLVATLNSIFSEFCEIRSVPKKAFLRVLAEYTLDKAQKRRILELCSRQGAADYTKCIRESQTCLLDIFHKFPSCKPPVERLLEHLPQLQPRYYSVTSSPLVDQSKFTVIFSLVQLPENKDRSKRTGVCTSYLVNTFSKKTSSIPNLEEQLAKMSLDSELKVYKRTNPNFVMPDDLTIPIIMIGPGTGVAPFVGFLQHREKAMRDQSNIPNGETFLFFGCRHENLDYIYKGEIERFHDQKVLNHLYLSFSRDGNQECRYVQDNIRSQGAKLISFILEKNAKVYVCGDAKNMAKDVANAFVFSYQESKKCSLVEATNWLKTLQEKKQYVQDIWL